MANEPRPQPTNALRLLFAYKDGEVRLVGRNEVHMILPAADQAARSAGEAGFWAELQDTAKRALFRRVMHDPIPHDTEVFSENPSQSVARIPTAAQEGVFTVLVPDVPEAESLAFFSSHHVPTEMVAPAVAGDHRVALRALSGPAALAPAQEIARFNIKKNT